MVKEERLFWGEKSSDASTMFQQNVQYSIQNFEVCQERRPNDPKENTYSSKKPTGNLAIEVTEHGFLNKYAYHALKLDKR